MNMNEYTKFAKELTNRKLLKEYRESVAIVCEIEAMKANGSQYYLGDPISIKLNDYKRWKAANIKELETRDYIISKIKL